THAEHFERLPVDGRIGAVGPTHIGGINPASHVSVEQGLREIERFRRYQLAVLIENDARNGPQGFRRGPSRPAPPTTTAPALSSPFGAITTTGAPPCPKGSSPASRNTSSAKTPASAAPPSSSGSVMQARSLIRRTKYLVWPARSSRRR